MSLQRRRNTPYSVNYLAKVVAEAMGLECKVERLDPRVEVKHAFSSHEKLERVFGTGAPAPLEDGIRRMVEWAKKAGARKGKDFDEIEIERNLPPSWARK